MSRIEKLQKSAQIQIEKPYDTTCLRYDLPQAKGFKERDSGIFQSVEVNIFSEVKSIYGDNIKVVVAEAPATTKVALLILLNIKATSVLKDLATDYKSS